MCFVFVRDCLSVNLQMLLTKLPQCLPLLYEMLYQQRGKGKGMEGEEGKEGNNREEKGRKSESVKGNPMTLKGRGKGRGREGEGAGKRKGLIPLASIAKEEAKVARKCFPAP